MVEPYYDQKIGVKNMVLFDTKKIFRIRDMPRSVRNEICNQADNGFMIRVFLAGSNDYPSTRRWALRNGAKRSDWFVYVRLR